MDELANRELHRLKGMAHHLDPLVQIGKKGLTPGVIENIDRMLKDHELIKVRFLEFKGYKSELAEEIAERTESHLIDIIGNVAIFYRENPNPQDRKIRL
jgi:RNA-binding protein